MEREFIIFFLKYCFEHCFPSKAAMARELGVGRSTLMRIIHPPHKFKAGTVPYEHLIWYCLTHQIDINYIFELFRKQYCEETNVLHEPSFGKLRCMDAMTKMITTDTNLCAKDQQELLHMSRTLCCCICQRCEHPPIFEEDVDCWVIRIVRSAIMYYKQH